jgi:hypothetical protein
VLYGRYTKRYTGAAEIKTKEIKNMSRKDDRRRKQRKAAANAVTVLENPGERLTAQEISDAVRSTGKSIETIRETFNGCKCPFTADAIGEAANMIVAGVRLAHSHGDEQDFIIAEADELEAELREIFEGYSLGAIANATRCLAGEFALRVLAAQSCVDCGDTGSFIHRATFVYTGEQVEEKTPEGALVQ